MSFNNEYENERFASPLGTPEPETNEAQPQPDAQDPRQEYGQQPAGSFKHGVNPPQQDASWNMYSPGICADRPAPRNRDGEYVAQKPERTRKSAAGSFVRAALLVIVCTFFSAAAAYLVTDYRFNRGDFTPTTNQVVLGGTHDAQPPENSNYTAPLAGLPDDEMLAQNIYDLATSQVIGVSVVTPESPFMFGMQGGEPSVIGSGFIISDDGYILTNYHVIDSAHNMDMPISVVLHDGSSYDALVVGFEEHSDVAVLKIDETGLSPAVIGDSDKLRVGQSIYAVGNPFGDLVYTMTDGIVSALDRVVSVDGRTIGTFQFSAAVNSGNSGGPVYNTSGEIIGIVTAKVTRGNVEGIGFAIPINDAIDIAAALIEHGYISGRPYLGVTVQPVSGAHAEYYGWVVGAYVRAVGDGSAAEKAGILVGDIIVAVAEEAVDSLETLRYALRQWRAGETTTITVWRSGETIDLTITFDEDLNAGKPGQPPVQLPDSLDPSRIFP